MKRIPLLILVIIIFLGACSPEETVENILSNDIWKIEYDNRGLTSIINNEDPYEASVIGGRLDANVRFRMNEGVWQTVFNQREMEAEDDFVRITNYTPGMPFSLEQTFSLVDDALDWDIVIENRMYYNVEIGDIYIEFPASSRPGYEQIDLFERGYLRHLFISGDGSFLFFSKRSGSPPYLIVTVKPGTSLEYYDGGTYYINSGYSGNRQQGTWRQEHTYNSLDPK